MNIFCDFIGSRDLAGALRRLFKTRLGYTIHFPDSSKEWSTKCGILNATNHVLREQAGGLDFISLEQFMDTSYNAVISTASCSETAMERLFKGNGKSEHFIRHIGNILETPEVADKVILGTNHNHQIDQSVSVINHLPEHPEIFKPGKSTTPVNRIFAFDRYTNPYEFAVKFMEHASNHFDGFDVGVLQENKDLKGLYELYNSSAAYVHLKMNGSCGFTLRQALACGLPVIVNKHYARIFSTLAETYLVDGKNCIDIDPQVRTMEEGLKLLNKWIQDPHRRTIISKFSLDTFDFHGRAARIKNWLESL